MKIYLVGRYDCESDITMYACKEYRDALERFNEIRLDLIQDISEMNIDDNYLEMYSSMLRNLLNPNPKEIDNYPHDTPYIQEIELE